MDEDEIISVSSDAESSAADVDRRATIEPIIQRVVDALGGYDTSFTTYAPGDSASACLSDLKKLWRQDATDPARTVARTFYSTQVLPNDLVPMLLVTNGDSRALKAADLMCAMTWPINVAEELQEMDEEDDDLDPREADYSSLLAAHRTYKAALLRPDVFRALIMLTMPGLARAPRERQPKDSQILGVVLHLVRNLAAIKDPPVQSNETRDEHAGLQAKLVRTLNESGMLELLLTLAANEDDDPMPGAWNTVVLEIFYLLLRGVKPDGLAGDHQKQQTENLSNLLALEARNRRAVARTQASRHSRFGTTISVSLNPSRKPSHTSEALDEPAPRRASAHAPGSQPLVLHRQAALTKSAGDVLDITKKSRAPRHGAVDELGGGARGEELSLEAKAVLRDFAREFLRGCFSPFLAGLLKDIKSERPKITEKDHLRLLSLTKWCLAFFLATRKHASKDTEDSPFSLVAEVTDRAWIVWILRRMRGAVDEKPKQWTELQGGIECLTQLLLLLDSMVSSASDLDLADAARALQQQFIYNGEVLDLAFDALKGYRAGTQARAYLDAAVNLAWAVIRAVEKAGKNDMYVRKKKARKTKRKSGGGEEEDEAEADKDHDDTVDEIMFTFEAFEMKFANSEITQTLLAYLSRYKEFDTPEPMRRVVSLLHRQAVRAKAEGLFFKASTLILFQSILAEEKTLPRDQPYKDLIKLINFLLRQFFKAVEENSFVCVEAFFPKNRSAWKEFSSYEPEAKEKRGRRKAEDSRFPPDVHVKKGFKWSEQVGIAIQVLVDAGQVELVHWVQDILTVVGALRQRIVDETDKKDGEDDDNGDADPGVDQEEEAKDAAGSPSNEAMAKFTDYMIPYISDEQAEAATRNPHLKLLFRLVHFFILEEGADELEWYVPAAIVPRDLQSCLRVITQYLDTPIDLSGKTAAQLLGKTRRRARRRARSSDSENGGDSDAFEDDPDAELRRKRRREKKREEKANYKSAQFIEDSDAEYGNMEDFLEKERELRERVAAAAAANGKIGTMKAKGTRKRGGKKKTQADNEEAPEDEEKDAPSDASEADGGQSPKRARSESEPALSPPATESRPKPRPRPKPVRKSHEAQSTLGPAGTPSRTPGPSPAKSPSPAGLDDEVETRIIAQPAKRKGRLVISDDEDE